MISRPLWNLHYRTVLHLAEMELRILLIEMIVQPKVKIRAEFE